MEDSSEQTPPLVAAPRHLRRRRFRADVPDPLLAPGVEPFQWGSKTDESTKARAPSPSVSPRTAYQRKRLVALVAVIAVCLAVPALVAALLLAG